ncbi:MAG TPA: hypothetical protein VFJ17_13135 [Mycobacteriales bacterium]|nr:hypothetical protein [Mycobacteriales bacterium]
MTEPAAPADYSVVARNIDPASDNKIHDDEVAQQFGFTGALVPGVELFAYLTHPLVEAWGEDWLSSGAIDVRFRQPVYDGEEVVARARSAYDGGVDLELRGPDGTVRSVGSARQVAERVVDLEAFVDSPLPQTLPPASAHSLPRGPLGSIIEKVDATAARRYLDDISEALPLYREDDVVHPGALLRMVNALLVRNVALGPWIHTGSSCVFLGIARVPTELRAHAVVTDTFERNGHDYVRYDALVLSDDIPVMYVDHTAIYRVAGA